SSASRKSICGYSVRCAIRAGVAALAVAAAAGAAAPERIAARVPMRDGVRLNGALYRPPGADPLPVLVVRTPYGTAPDLPPGYELFLGYGYGVFVQHVRGRGGSEGSFRPLRQERTDGRDTVEWVARQKWCDGRVGMLGASYLGITQWKAALEQPPSLKAISPVMSGYDEYFDRFYSRGGALKPGHRLSWLAQNLRPPGTPEPPFDTYTRHLPLRTADRAATGRTIEFWQEALNHPSRDLWWRAVSTADQLDRVQVPVFIIGGWYDNFVESDLAAFEALSARANVHRVLIGPWPHAVNMRFPAVDFGRDAVAPIRRLQAEWFNQRIRGVLPATPPAPVRIFVMGANRWRDENEWPLARTRYTAFYLASGNVLASEPRAGDTPARFTFDPARPVPTMGGAVCCTPRIFPWGPMDQRPIESRGDVLVYTTPALDSDIEVTGAVRAVLWVSTNAPDTDFTAKLVDVYPDGRVINLCDGILRLRYRQSLEQPVFMKANDVARIVIQAGVTSNLFKAGHRVRVEISSSNFPRFDRNSNTGGRIADERQFRKAAQTVWQGPQRPSHILLPVIP
ncbi:MAG TPA: CocE/NonD family hydrolase, partial [Bryobacteraceae bacterium]|nr:CocE/NonD family hydrolase [Bryobacteraceae bacterium]